MEIAVFSGQVDRHIVREIRSVHARVRTEQ